MADEPPPPPPTLESMFEAFAKYNAGLPCNSDGTTILLSQSDLWMRQSQLINKQLTLTDTGMHFSQFK